MNAFSYGWKDGRETAHSFWARFEHGTHPPGTWQEELSAAARHIASTSRKPLWIAFSGGMDSEVVCRIFHDLGIQFSALTMQEIAGSNEEDVSRAKEWCWKRGVPHAIVRYDMSQLLEKELPRYISEGYITDAIGRYIQLLALEEIEQRGGHAVLGSGICIPRVAKVPEPTAQDVYIRLNVGHVVTTEWCKNKGAHHTPNFFCATPESYTSYFELPAMALATEHPTMLNNTTGAFIIKLMAYQIAWPDIRPRYADFGFKSHLHAMKLTREHIRKTYATQLQARDIPYPTLISDLAIQK